jgi:hypothetical protein
LVSVQVVEKVVGDHVLDALEDHASFVEYVVGQQLEE